MKYFNVSIVCLMTVALPFSVVAESTHAHSKHGQHLEEVALTEPGQGAFATLSEVVSRLNANPKTNWETVNIRALRDHLVDMSDLVLKSEFKIMPIENGLKFVFDKSKDINKATMRMVPAHSDVLEQETGWANKIEETDSKLIWSVTSPQDRLKINKLGFYGLMATGDHHREHHFALATGNPMH